RARGVLDTRALTIGFARRFATYKRATLLFHDVARLKRILCDAERPVQVIVAGKAHPKDHPGKTFIRDIVQLSRDPDLWRRVVFVEDYDLKVAREMVQGVDIWLNNPRRGEEACGTSGMKAGINGVLNLSILDGWFDEALEISGGWAIGDRDSLGESQDDLDASAIYYLLENEIVPMFYESRDRPAGEWVRRMKRSLTRLSPVFDSRHMVMNYHNQLYAPAHSASVELREGGLEKARRKACWNAKVAAAWDQVVFVDASPSSLAPLPSGSAIGVRATVELGALSAEDVRVEVVLGRVGANGHLEETEVVVLPAVERDGTRTVFAKEVMPLHTGRIGYALRVSPNHYDDPLTRPCPDLLRWG
ncbi:MAG: alpha-glucan family phosphorylase, partial [Bryobacteraceae bacterium]